jgi:uncharacterized protein (DUF885 family)
MMRQHAARALAAVKLHADQWTPEKAAGYMTGEAGLGRVAAERLIALDALRPGEAIGPVVGRWQIERLRDRYAEAGGQAAPLGGFHADLLARGAMPLDLAGKEMPPAAADRPPVAPEESGMR